MTLLFAVLLTVGLAQLAVGVTELRTDRVIVRRPGVRLETVWWDGAVLALIGATVAGGALLQVAGLSAAGLGVMLGGLALVALWSVGASIRHEVRSRRRS